VALLRAALGNSLAASAASGISSAAQAGGLAAQAWAELRKINPAKSF
jgi:hypothetical protein